MRHLSSLARRRFDALVIGGGINGAGIARDLALRGLTVLLAEQGDFASGTSSASTKLIHGGLRYLERIDLRLVFESLRERRILQNIAPHLVRPLPILLPVYRGDPRPLALIRAGLTLYDLLALYRTPGRHRSFDRTRALALEPGLQPEGLTGAALYWDCRMDDARLCLENVLAAREAGAETVNYLEVTGLIHAGGRIRGAMLLDRETGDELEVEAAAIINATGPWLDRLRALDGDSQPMLRPTRGSHILLPRRNRGDEALYLTAGRDERLFFVIPWGDLSLVGTTDVDFAGDPGTVRPTGEDIDYLLAETGRHLRGAPPGRSDVVAAFAGIRPLVADEGRSASRVSREHRIVVSPSGLISVGGGKYTTYRAVAAEVARSVTRRLGRGAGPSATGRLPLPGGAIDGAFEPYRQQTAPALARDFGLDQVVVEGLLDLYGARTPEVLNLLRQEPELGRPVVEGSPLLAVQVAWAADRELARTPEDVLRRRTPLALSKGRGLSELDAVAALLAHRLQAPADLQARWRKDYLDRYANL